MGVLCAFLASVTFPHGVCLFVDEIILLLEDSERIEQFYPRSFVKEPCINRLPPVFSLE